jgi:hypothetical protein
MGTRVRRGVMNVTSKQNGRSGAFREIQKLARELRTSDSPRKSFEISRKLADTSRRLPSSPEKK